MKPIESTHNTNKNAVATSPRAPRARLARASARSPGSRRSRSETLLDVPLAGSSPARAPAIDSASFPRARANGRIARARDVAREPSRRARVDARARVVVTTGDRSFFFVSGRRI